MSTRRTVIAGASAAVAVAAAAGTWSPDMTSSRTMPVIYVPHGGGPWPWMENRFFGGFSNYDPLRSWLQALPNLPPEPPRAILAVSAHWEEPIPTVSTAAQPGMLYDYY